MVSAILKKKKIKMFVLKPTKFRNVEISSYDGNSVDVDALLHVKKPTMCYGQNLQYQFIGGLSTRPITLKPSEVERRGFIVISRRLTSGIDTWATGQNVMYLLVKKNSKLPADCTILHSVPNDHYVTLNQSKGTVRLVGPFTAPAGAGPEIPLASHKDA